MKKTLFLSLLWVGMALTASAQQRVRVGNLYYELSENEATATVTYESGSSSSNYKNLSGAVTIPSTITYGGQEYAVTSIGDRAFHDCFNLTSVTIPEGVTSIGYNAFLACYSLVSVTIPESVTSIGAFAFSETALYNDQSNWRDGVLYIDKCLVCAEETIAGVYNIIPGTRLIACQAFFYCRGLTSVSIPEGVTSIGTGTFYGCSSLTSVTIPSRVTSIGSEVFRDCSNLTLVNIPESVTNIGARAFAGCRLLNSVAISENVTSIGACAFYDCSSLTSVTIPEGVTSIENGTFSDCSSLTSVSIPSGVASINYEAFYNCRGLTSVFFSNGVSRIGEGAFSSCSSLTSVTIPESVTSIGSRAFKDCSNLALLSLWNGVDSIGESAFSGCYSLASVSIPESVTSIGTSAFYGCSGLASVVIPNSVQSIGKSAFELCSNLSSVTIPESVTRIDSCAFKGCTSLTSVTIPESVTGIETYAFCDLDTLNYNAVACGHVGDRCWSGIKMVRVGEMVKSFPDGAFVACDSLNAVYYANDLAAWCKLSFADGKANPLCNGADLYIGDVAVTPELVIPEGLGTIGNYAFYGSHLLSLTLPADLEQIDGIGIIDNTELKTMTCYADYPPACTEATFGGVDKSVLLHVPETGLDDYLRHPVWRSFYNIRPFKKNGFTTPTLSEAITVVNSEVHLNLPGTFEAQVYDLQGRCVLSTTESRFTLPQGVYIIKVGDEAVKLSL